MDELDIDSQIELIKEHETPKNSNISVYFAWNERHTKIAFFNFLCRKFCLNVETSGFIFGIAINNEFITVYKVCSFLERHETLEWQLLFKVFYRK